MDVTSADGDYELWVLLHQTKDAIYKAREKELRQFGLSPVTAAALLVVESIDGPATPNEIARWLSRKSHTVFGLVSRMEKEGLVTRTKDLEKKNLVRVALTEKGRQALRLSMERLVIHHIFSSLSEGQRQQLTPCLSVLLDKALDQLGMERKLPFLER
ncbi:MarR family winged helix-turn-helix transcriptional regulator [Chloroflexota bacterium]